MSVHLHRAVDKLKQDLLSLCALVEDQAQRAVRALLDRDLHAAKEVQRRDAEIDQREVEVEEDCLRVLALYQPVAGDLRFIVAALKINNDLERIGDLAVNIARKAATFASLTPMEIPFDLAGMWRKTQAMLRDSLDSLVNLDTALAENVCLRDDEVDRCKRNIRLKCTEMIRQDPDLTAALLTLMAASRNLERIADQATNIAEEVIYMVEGKIVRHSEGNGNKH
ncbi:MAG: phosphate transport system regulatory protein PhoU [Planctomycetaceae bacterium]|nr:MAG: phosphate transport system regulatory protein PhoU [Planctomycetaceae bacterium]